MVKGPAEPRLQAATRRPHNHHFLVKPCHLASGLPTLSLAAPQAGCSIASPNREFTPSCQSRCRLTGKIVGACPFMRGGVVFTMLPVYTATSERIGASDRRVHEAPGETQGGPTTGAALRRGREPRPYRCRSETPSLSPNCFLPVPAIVLVLLQALKRALSAGGQPFEIGSFGPCEELRDS